MMAVVQLRNATQGRAYYDRKRADGKSPNEAMRCLKRRLSDIVYRAMLNDYVANGAGSRGHRDAATQLSPLSPMSSRSGLGLHVEGLVGEHGLVDDVGQSAFQAA